jgi:hypothetical protein
MSLQNRKKYSIVFQDYVSDTINQLKRRLPLGVAQEVLAKTKEASFSLNEITFYSVLKSYIQSSIGDKFSFDSQDVKDFAVSNFMVSLGKRELMILYQFTLTYVKLHS